MDLSSAARSQKSYPDETDDVLSLEHNPKEVGNQANSIINEAIEWMLLRSRFSSKTVDSSNPDSEVLPCQSSEDCVNNGAASGVSVDNVRTLSEPVGMVHPVQGETVFSAFEAATSEEIGLGNDVVEISISIPEGADSEVCNESLGDGDYSNKCIVEEPDNVDSEEVIGDLSFQDLIISSKSEPDCKIDSSSSSELYFSLNDNIDISDTPQKQALTASLTSLSDGDPEVQITMVSSDPEPLNKISAINIECDESSGKSFKSSLKMFYESEARNLISNDNDNETSINPEMPVLEKASEVAPVLVCHENPPVLIPETKIVSVLPEPVVGVVHPFNRRDSNGDVDCKDPLGLKATSNIEKARINSDQVRQIKTRDRLQTRRISIVNNSGKCDVKTYATVFVPLRNSENKKKSKLIRGTMNNLSVHIAKSKNCLTNSFPPNMNVRQGISSGNVYRVVPSNLKSSSFCDEKSVSYEEEKESTNFESRLPLITQTYSQKVIENKLLFTHNSKSEIGENSRNTISCTPSVGFENKNKFDMKIKENNTLFSDEICETYVEVSDGKNSLLGNGSIPKNLSSTLQSVTSLNSFPRKISARQGISSGNMYKVMPSNMKRNPFCEDEHSTIEEESTNFESKLPLITQNYSQKVIENKLLFTHNSKSEIGENSKSTVLCTSSVDFVNKGKVKQFDSEVKEINSTPETFSAASAESNVNNNSNLCSEKSLLPSMPSLMSPERENVPCSYTLQAEHLNTSKRAVGQVTRRAKSGTKTNVMTRSFQRLDLSQELPCISRKKANDSRKSSVGTKIFETDTNVNKLNSSSNKRVLIGKVEELTDQSNLESDVISNSTRKKEDLTSTENEFGLVNDISTNNNPSNSNQINSQVTVSCTVVNSHCVLEKDLDYGCSNFFSLSDTLLSAFETQVMTEGNIETEVMSESSSDSYFDSIRLLERNSSPVYNEAEVNSSKVDGLSFIEINSSDTSKTESPSSVSSVTLSSDTSSQEYDSSENLCSQIDKIDEILYKELANSVNFDDVCDADSVNSPPKLYEDGIQYTGYPLELSEHGYAAPKSSSTRQDLLKDPANKEVSSLDESHICISSPTETLIPCPVEDFLASSDSHVPCNGEISESCTDPANASTSSSLTSYEESEIEQNVDEVQDISDVNCVPTNLIRTKDPQESHATNAAGSSEVTDNNYVISVDPTALGVDSPNKSTLSDPLPLSSELDVVSNDNNSSEKNPCDLINPENIVCQSSVLPLDLTSPTDIACRASKAISVGGAMSEAPSVSKANVSFTLPSRDSAVLDVNLPGSHGANSDESEDPSIVISSENSVCKSPLPPLGATSIHIPSLTLPNKGLDSRKMSDTSVVPKTSVSFTLDGQDPVALGGKLLGSNCTDISSADNILSENSSASILPDNSLCKSTVPILDATITAIVSKQVTSQTLLSTPIVSKTCASVTPHSQNSVLLDGKLPDSCSSSHTKISTSQDSNVINFSSLNKTGNQQSTSKNTPDLIVSSNKLIQKERTILMVGKTVVASKLRHEGSEERSRSFSPQIGRFSELNNNNQSPLKDQRNILTKRNEITHSEGKNVNCNTSGESLDSSSFDATMKSNNVICKESVRHLENSKISIQNAASCNKLNKNKQFSKSSNSKKHVSRIDQIIDRLHENNQSSIRLSQKIEGCTSLKQIMDHSEINNPVILQHVTNSLDSNEATNCVQSECSPVGKEGNKLGERNFELTFERDSGEISSKSEDSSSSKTLNGIQNDGNKILDSCRSQSNTELSNIGIQLPSVDGFANSPQQEKVNKLNCDVKLKSRKNVDKLGFDLVKHVSKEEIKNPLPVIVIIKKGRMILDSMKERLSNKIFRLNERVIQKPSELANQSFGDVQKKDTNNKTNDSSKKSEIIADCKKVGLLPLKYKSKGLNKSSKSKIVIQRQEDGVFSTDATEKIPISNPAVIDSGSGAFSSYGSHPSDVQSSNLQVECNVSFPILNALCKKDSSFKTSEQDASQIPSTTKKYIMEPKRIMDSTKSDELLDKISRIKPKLNKNLKHSTKTLLVQKDNTVTVVHKAILQRKNCNIQSQFLKNEKPLALSNDGEEVKEIIKHGVQGIEIKLNGSTSERVNESEDIAFSSSKNHKGKKEPIMPLNKNMLKNERHSNVKNLLSSNEQTEKSGSSHEKTNKKQQIQTNVSKRLSIPTVRRKVSTGSVDKFEKGKLKLVVKSQNRETDSTSEKYIHTNEREFSNSSLNTDIKELHGGMRDKKISNMSKNLETGIKNDVIPLSDNRTLKFKKKVTLPKASSKENFSSDEFLMHTKTVQEVIEDDQQKDNAEYVHQITQIKKLQDPQCPRKEVLEKDFSVEGAPETHEEPAVLLIESSAEKEDDTDKEKQEDHQKEYYTEDTIRTNDEKQEILKKILSREKTVGNYKKQPEPILQKEFSTEDAFDSNKDKENLKKVFSSEETVGAKEKKFPSKESVRTNRDQELLQKGSSAERADGPIDVQEEAPLEQSPAERADGPLDAPEKVPLKQSPAERVDGSIDVLDEAPLEQSPAERADGPIDALEEVSLEQSPAERADGSIDALEEASLEQSPAERVDGSIDVLDEAPLEQSPAEQADGPIDALEEVSLEQSPVERADGSIDALEEASIEQSPAERADGSIDALDEASLEQSPAERADGSIDALDEASLEQSPAERADGPLDEKNNVFREKNISIPTSNIESSEEEDTPEEYAPNFVPFSVAKCSEKGCNPEGDKHTSTSTSTIQFNKTHSSLEGEEPIVSPISHIEQNENEKGLEQAEPICTSVSDIECRGEQSSLKGEKPVVSLINNIEHYGSLKGDKPVVSLINNIEQNEKRLEQAEPICTFVSDIECREEQSSLNGGEPVVSLINNIEHNEKETNLEQTESICTSASDIECRGEQSSLKGEKPVVSLINNIEHNEKETILGRTERICTSVSDIECRGEQSSLKGEKPVVSLINNSEHNEKETILEQTEPICTSVSDIECREKQSSLKGEKPVVSLINKIEHNEKETILGRTEPICTSVSDIECRGEQSSLKGEKPVVSLINNSEHNEKETILEQTEPICTSVSDIECREKQSSLKGEKPVVSLINKIEHNEKETILGRTEPICTSVSDIECRGEQSCLKREKPVVSLINNIEHNGSLKGDKPVVSPINNIEQNEKRLEQAEPICTSVSDIECREECSLNGEKPVVSLINKIEHNEKETILGRTEPICPFVSEIESREEQSSFKGKKPVVSLINNIEHNEKETILGRTEPICSSVSDIEFRGEQSCLKGEKPVVSLINNIEHNEKETILEQTEPICTSVSDIECREERSSLKGENPVVSLINNIEHNENDKRLEQAEPICTSVREIECREEQSSVKGEKPVVSLINNIEHNEKETILERTEPICTSVSDIECREKQSSLKGEEPVVSLINNIEHNENDKRLEQAEPICTSVSEIECREEQSSFKGKKPVVSLINNIEHNEKETILERTEPICTSVSDIECREKQSSLKGEEPVVSLINNIEENEKRLEQAGPICTSITDIECREEQSSLKGDKPFVSLIDNIGHNENECRIEGGKAVDIPTSNIESSEEEDTPEEYAPNFVPFSVAKCSEKGSNPEGDKHKSTSTCSIQFKKTHSSLEGEEPVGSQIRQIEFNDEENGLDEDQQLFVNKIVNRYIPVSSLEGNSDETVPDVDDDDPYNKYSPRCYKGRYYWKPKSRNQSKCNIVSAETNDSSKCTTTSSLCLKGQDAKNEANLFDSTRPDDISVKCDKTLSFNNAENFIHEIICPTENILQVIKNEGSDKHKERRVLGKDQPIKRIRSTLDHPSKRIRIDLEDHSSNNSANEETFKRTRIKSNEKTFNRNRSTSCDEKPFNRTRSTSNEKRFKKTRGKSNEKTFYRNGSTSCDEKPFKRTRSTSNEKRFKKTRGKSNEETFYRNRSTSCDEKPLKRPRSISNEKSRQISDEKLSKWSTSIGTPEIGPSLTKKYYNFPEKESKGHYSRAKFKLNETSLHLFQKNKVNSKELPSLLQKLNKEVYSSENVISGHKSKRRKVKNIREDTRLVPSLCTQNVTKASTMPEAYVIVDKIDSIFSVKKCIKEFRLKSISLPSEVYNSMLDYGESHDDSEFEIIPCASGSIKVLRKSKEDPKLSKSDSENEDNHLQYITEERKKRRRIRNSKRNDKKSSIFSDESSRRTRSNNTLRETLSDRKSLPKNRINSISCSKNRGRTLTSKDGGYGLPVQIPVSHSKDHKALVNKTDTHSSPETASEKMDIQIPPPSSSNCIPKDSFTSSTAFSTPAPENVGYSAPACNPSYFFRERTSLYASPASVVSAPGTIDHCSVPAHITSDSRYLAASVPNFQPNQPTSVNPVPEITSDKLPLRIPPLTSTDSCLDKQVDSNFPHEPLRSDESRSGASSSNPSCTFAKEKEQMDELSSVVNIHDQVSCEVNQSISGAASQNRNAFSTDYTFPDLESLKYPSSAKNVIDRLLIKRFRKRKKKECEPEDEFKGFELCNNCLCLCRPGYFPDSCSCYYYRCRKTIDSLKNAAKKCCALRQGSLLESQIRINYRTSSPSHVKSTSVISNKICTCRALDAQLLNETLSNDVSELENRDKKMEMKMELECFSAVPNRLETNLDPSYTYDTPPLVNPSNEDLNMPGPSRQRQCRQVQPGFYLLRSSESDGDDESSDS